jgi:hypothetical protein
VNKENSGSEFSKSGYSSRIHGNSEGMSHKTQNFWGRSNTVFEIASFWWFMKEFTDNIESESLHSDISSWLSQVTWAIIRTASQPLSRYFIAFAQIVDVGYNIQSQCQSRNSSSPSFSGKSQTSCFWGYVEIGQNWLESISAFGSWISGDF